MAAGSPQQGDDSHGGRGGEIPGDGSAPRSSDRHALEALEFGRVLELVADRATSELGKERVRELRPFSGPDAARRELERAGEMASFLRGDDPWAPPPVPRARGALERLSLEGATLEGEELRSVGILLASARRARKDVLRWSSEYPRLAEVAGQLTKHRELEEDLERSLEEDGRVADDASPALKEVRDELRGARNDLVSRLEEFSRNLSDRYRVPDGSVTVRAGRYCVPVRREGRSEVGGLVHDESASGQTLFVEPPVAIEPMNRIRELELREEREARRVLEELTERARPLLPDLRVSLEALAELDSLFARGKYALEHGGTRPELGADEERGRYRVVEGYHPLLRASGERAVPFDLELEPDEKVVLVSGPNAGGKTVLLKSIGLLSALAQSGIVPPVGPDTRLPVFGDFFAVIGDEQSIEASLSTFSAQVQNLREILRESDGRSLVLVDEVGGNTDPAEGAALAAAFLIRMAEQAGLTVATSHLGQLKGLAGEEERVVNASLQFDREHLRPTYRLRRDRPGRSYALEIAERMGLPDDVLDEARGRVGGGERAVEEVLSELESREEELRRLTAEARSERRRLRERSREQEERARELERREAEIERRAQEQAEKYLLEARERVEEAIERLERRHSAEGGGEAEAQEAEAGELRSAAAEARREVEEAVRERRSAKPEVPEEEREPPEELAEGDRVRVRSLDRTGEVEELREDEVVVRSDGFRLTVGRGDVEVVEAEDGGEDGAADKGGGAPASAGGGSRPAAGARPEVDLRGLRVDEVEQPLLSALDSAIVADLSRLRVIHGKGTGALRERVREILQGEDRIHGYRAGEPGEGGSGVTIVRIRPDEAGASGA